MQHFRSSLLPAFDRGVEFGSAFPDEIRSTIRFYRDMLSRCPIPGVDLSRGGERALKVIGEFSPSAAEEIRGIAAGAGVAANEIAGINARTELLALADPDGTVECSTIVHCPAGGPVRGAQTWDWYAQMSGGWLLWTIPSPDGSSLATVTEYGILAKIGINDAGLGVLFSILHHETDGQGRVGVPVHVLARTVLEQAQDRSAALTTVKRAWLSASSTLTLLDHSGATSVELFPGGSGVIECEKTWLIRANDFLSPEGISGCRAHVFGENSTVRRRALMAHTRNHASATDESLIRALVGHAVNGPLCVHASPDSTDATLATVVMDTSIPSLSVWRGGPCDALDWVGVHGPALSDAV